MIVALMILLGYGKQKFVSALLAGQQSLKVVHKIAGEFSGE
jgi:hypothetical protein